VEKNVRLATAFRVVVLLSAVLFVLAVAEARTIRELRAELQQLRSERDEFQAGLAKAWTERSTNEFRAAVQWLHELYEEPIDGLGRPGGLCAAGAPDHGAIAEWVLGVFMKARAEGRPHRAALDVTYEAIVRSDAYRAAHPDRAPPPDVRR
jgi:hypothetical protein